MVKNIVSKIGPTIMYYLLIFLPIIDAQDKENTQLSPTLCVDITVTSQMSVKTYQFSCLSTICSAFCLS